jgi:dihydrofolate reductase
MSFTRMQKGQSTDIRLFDSLELLDPALFPTDIFICVVADVYAQTLPRCSDLYLTVVKRQCEGDAFFPPFESMFQLHEMIFEGPEFEIRHYRHRGLE